MMISLYKKEDDCHDEDDRIIHRGFPKSILGNSLVIMMMIASYTDDDDLVVHK